MSYKNHPDLIQRKFVEHLSKCRWCSLSAEYDNWRYACDEGLGFVRILKQANLLQEVGLFPKHIDFEDILSAN